MGERQKGSCLLQRKMEKRVSSGQKLKINLPGQMGEGVGVACLLKRHNNHYIDNRKDNHSSHLEGATQLILSVLWMVIASEQ